METLKEVTDDDAHIFPVVDEMRRVLVPAGRLYILGCGQAEVGAEQYVQCLADTLGHPVVVNEDDVVFRGDVPYVWWLNPFVEWWGEGAWIEFVPRRQAR